MSGEAVKNIESFFTPILDFLDKLDGIDEVVLVSEEGFPVDFRKIDKSGAEAVAALAVDYTISTADILREALGRLPEGVVIDIDGKKIINIVKIKDLMLIVRGDKKPVEEALKPIYHAIQGRRIKCPNCGADLTLETYKCPHCGKIIPFTAETCPHCSSNVKVKKCPKCRARITGEGRLVVRRKSPISRIAAALEGTIAGIGLGVAVLLYSSSLALAGVIGLVTGITIGYIIYRVMPEEEVELPSSRH